MIKATWRKEMSRLLNSTCRSYWGRGLFLSSHKELENRSPDRWFSNPHIFNEKLPFRTFSTNMESGLHRGVLSEAAAPFTHLWCFHPRWAAWKEWCPWRCRETKPPCRFHSWWERPACRTTPDFLLINRKMSDLRSVTQKKQRCRRDSWRTTWTLRGRSLIYSYSCTKKCDKSVSTQTHVLCNKVRIISHRIFVKF